MRSQRADEAFSEFVASSWSRLRWTAFLLTGDRALAEDLAQTALEKTYARWTAVRRDDAFAYARRAMVNSNVDRLRRKRVDEVALIDADVTVDADATPADRDQIVRLLARLSERERKIVVLRYYADLSEGEVARELRISVGTVKSTASRALAKLRVEPPAAERPPTDIRTNSGKGGRS